MKRTISEVLIIIGVAVLLALFYNAINPKGLNFFEEDKKMNAAEDNELFQSDSLQNNDNPVKVDSTENNVTDKKQDETNNSNKPKVDDNKIKPDKISNDEIEEIKDSFSDVKEVNYEQMKKIVKDASFVIVDARSPELFEESKIGDSINIFPYTDDQDAMVQKIFELPMDKKIVVYCDGGTCDASHKLTEMIVQFGYEHVYIYPGGWEEWSAKR